MIELFCEMSRAIRSCSASVVAFRGSSGAIFGPLGPSIGDVELVMLRLLVAVRSGEDLTTVARGAADVVIAGGDSMLI